MIWKIEKNWLSLLKRQTKQSLHFLYIKKIGVPSAVKIIVCYDKNLFLHITKIFCEKKKMKVYC